jgi:hypothetical protein
MTHRSPHAPSLRPACGGLVAPRLVCGLTLLALVGCVAAESGTESDDAGDGESAGSDESVAGSDSTGPTDGSGGTHHPPNGEITEDTTWRRADGPHFVTSGMWITDATLTIEAGAEVHFESGGFYVSGASGRLLTQGTAEEPVLFLGLADGACHVQVGGTLALGTADLEHTVLRDCDGTSGYPGVITAIGDVDDNNADGPRREALRVRDVVIENPYPVGVLLRRTATFTPDSSGLVVTGAAEQPMQIDRQALVNLPTGEYADNGIPEIMVMIEGSRADEDLHMPALGVPYRIDYGDLWVGDGTTSTKLTVDAGVTVRMYGGYGLWLAPDASIDARGTADAPIVFTSSSDSPSAGDWTGLVFSEPLSGDNRMEHVRIEYGGANAGNPLEFEACYCGEFEVQYCDAEALVVLEGEPPAPFISNSTFAHSLSHAIQHGYTGDRVDFAASNSFEGISECAQTATPAADESCGPESCP